MKKKIFTLVTLCIFFAISTYAQQDANLLPGKFSVSPTKKVQFTKGNLYWDGKAYHLEKVQTATSQGQRIIYDSNHVSHFFWTSITDYKAGNPDRKPYAPHFNCSSLYDTDKFWCGEENPLTVDGTSNLYVLSGGNNGEWKYLIDQRPNAKKLRKCGVTVGQFNNCLIIAPDDYDFNANPLKSTYSIYEIISRDLVCLPAAGLRMYGKGLDYGNQKGRYWSSVPQTTYVKSAYNLHFWDNELDPVFYADKAYGQSIRLVKTCSK